MLCVSVWVYHSLKFVWIWGTSAQCIYININSNRVSVCVCVCMHVVWICASDHMCVWCVFVYFVKEEMYVFITSEIASSAELSRTAHIIVITSSTLIGVCAWESPLQCGFGFKFNLFVCDLLYLRLISCLYVCLCMCFCRLFSIKNEVIGWLVGFFWLPWLSLVNIIMLSIHISIIVCE